MLDPFALPPRSKWLLTRPDELARRLSLLLGRPVPLTLKTRTDGSNIRKLVAQTLSRFPLPEPCSEGEFAVVPDKGIPRLLLEFVDTYIVTSGDSYNLQVWNRFPASPSVLVEYADGDPLLSNDVRFVFVRVDVAYQTIRSVVVLTPDYIEARFGRFGKPTIKHQLIITPTARERILARTPPMLLHADTPAIDPLLGRQLLTGAASMHQTPIPGRVVPLCVLGPALATQLIGTRLDQASTKTRGQALETVVGNLLGYRIGGSDLLAGGYPDIRSQLLEVKVQDSPTVDLGRFSPQYPEEVLPGVLTSDVRYLVALTDQTSGVIQGLVLCPGGRLGEHFSYVSDTSFKCQRSVPMSFFDRYDGCSVYNP